MHLRHAVRLVDCDVRPTPRTSSRAGSCHITGPDPLAQRFSGSSHLPQRPVYPPIFALQDAPNRPVKALSKSSRPRQNQVASLVPPVVSRAAGDFLCYIL